MLIYSHMKRSAIAAFASLLLAMPPAIAKITCADSIFTYGQVPSGSILNHTFTIKNDGQETVKINRVLSGCGCLSAKTDKESLKPTETAEIKATLSLRGRSGKQFKSIFVYTDSSETPIVRLETRGIALPSPTITERVAGEASSKKHRSLQEMIRPSGDSPTSQKIHAIPGLLRLPSKANQKGTFSFIAVRSTGGDEFKISNVTPPPGINYALLPMNNGQAIKLGPIKDPAKLKGTEIVITTTEGKVIVPIKVIETESLPYHKP